MARRPRRTHKEDGYVRIRLGPSLRQKCITLQMRLEWPSMNQYMRHLIERGVAEDSRSLPSLALHLRPGSTVFKMTEQDTLQPIAQGLGGERVWVLDVIAALPSSLGGQVGYVCDLTAGDTSGGLEGRGVVVRQKDVM